LQRDPIGYEAMDVNIYRYANNNPIMSYDSSGLQASNAVCPASVAGHFAKAYAAANSAVEKARVIAQFIDLMATLCGTTITVSEAEILLKVERECKKTKEKCSVNYSSYDSCARFSFTSITNALNALKKRTGIKNLTKHHIESAEKCKIGEGIGTHCNVRSGSVIIASILCCPCCEDTANGPIIKTKCKTQ
jgi:hypothetical protein